MRPNALPRAHALDSSYGHASWLIKLCMQKMRVMSQLVQQIIWTEIECNRRTNGWTDTTDRFTQPANAVGNQYVKTTAACGTLPGQVVVVISRCALASCCSRCIRAAAVSVPRLRVLRVRLGCLHATAAPTHNTTRHLTCPDSTRLNFY